MGDSVKSDRMQKKSVQAVEPSAVFQGHPGGLLRGDVSQLRQLLCHAVAQQRHALGMVVSDTQKLFFHTIITHKINYYNSAEENFRTKISK